MKMWAHLAVVFSIFFALDLVVVLAVYGLGLTAIAVPTTLLAVVGLVYAVVVTNGPGGILLKRFYEAHRVHALDTAKLFRRISLKTPSLEYGDQRARRTLRLSAAEGSGFVFENRAAEEEEEKRLAHAKSHLRGFGYGKAWKEFEALSTAVETYEGNYASTRGVIERECVKRLGEEFPGLATAPNEGTSSVNHEIFTALAWRCLLAPPATRKTRGYEALHETAPQPSGKRSFIHVYQPAFNGGNIAVLEATGDGGEVEKVKAVFGELTTRADLIQAAEEVFEEQGRMETLFREFARALDPIIDRINRNEDLAGRCDDCPHFRG
jgi:hypothetical protein